MKNPDLLSLLEALLFINGEPLSFFKLAKVLRCKEEEVRTALETLSRKYEEDGDRGLAIVVREREVQLVTKGSAAAFVEDLTKSTMQENLSKAALEVLAIVAYRAPLSRAEVEAIRGVNCSFTLRNLLLRGLIVREGNPDDGRGYVYRPSFRFLQSLGIHKIEDLPDHETLSCDERLTFLEKDVPEEKAGSENESSQEKETL